MKLTSKDINSIAQDLECGMKVFINKDTLEIRTVLDWDEIADPEFWEDELEEIEMNGRTMLLSKSLSRGKLLK